jgi:hypothetical protein
MTTESVNHTLAPIPYTPVQYTPAIDPEAIQRALMAGDIAKLSPADRVQFYAALCRSTGLNVLSRPFILLKTQGGDLTWYATVGAAEQLRRLHRVSTRLLSRERTEDGLYIVTVQASTPDGRQEEAQGIVAVAGLKGQELGNAMMKASSKALRRVTLALVGLGIALEGDEAGQVVPFDPQTGEVALEPETPALPAGDLLTQIGAWFRRLPKAARPVVAQAVWGLTLHEIPQASLDDLAAGWYRLDAGRAPLAWDSATLEDDLRQWLQGHAQGAMEDLFGEDEGD